LLGHKKQGAYAHAAAAFQAAPGLTHGARVVLIASGGAPRVGQLKAGFVWKLAFDRGQDFGPFVARAVGRDVAKGCGDGFRGVCLLHF
jgi:hypothetical protein